MSPKEELWLQGLHTGRHMRFRPLGSSMIPFLRSSDVVSIEPRREAGLGQVVLFGSGDNLLLHRVVARRNGRLITKGDALGRLDLPVAVGQILGVAVAREREGKVTRLDTFGARFRGLGFCLATLLIPRLVPLLGGLRRWVRRLTLCLFS